MPLKEEENKSSILKAYLRGIAEYNACREVENPYIHRNHEGIMTESEEAVFWEIGRQMAYLKRRCPWCD